MLTHRIVQLNINKSWRARDLLEHSVKKGDFSLALITGPPKMKENDHW